MAPVCYSLCLCVVFVLYMYNVCGYTNKHAYTCSYPCALGTCTWTSLVPGFPSARAQFLRVMTFEPVQNKRIIGRLRRGAWGRGYTWICMFTLFCIYLFRLLADQVLKIGNLHKTSQSRRTDAEAGPTRQRRFRLTAESLEYFQQFSHVSIRE